MLFAVNTLIQWLFLKFTASLSTNKSTNNSTIFWPKFCRLSTAHTIGHSSFGSLRRRNCHARSAHGRDAHIDLTVTPSDAYDERRHVIVEVTPRWRGAMARSGVDWETDTLR